MSVRFDYKATVLGVAGVIAIKQHFEDLFYRSSNLSYSVDGASDGNTHVVVYGDCSAMSIDSTLQQINEIYDALKVSGTHSLEIDDEPYISSGFGQQGQDLRVKQLNQEIASKLEELRSLVNIDFNHPTSLSTGQPSNGNVNEFVAFRSMSNYDPNVSALLALQERGSMEILNMTTKLNEFLDGKIAVTDIVNGFNSSIDAFNNEVDAAVQISIKRKNSHRM